MPDMEKWIKGAPDVKAPENFLDKLMARIRGENIKPLPVRPTLPVDKIGYALIATAAAMLLLTPLIPQITEGVAYVAGQVSAFLSGFARPRPELPTWP